MASLADTPANDQPLEGPSRREWYRSTYLKSEHWRTMREGALDRAERRCQVCNGAKHLDVHHRTYERLGEERPADLTVLCRKCHDLFHAGSKVKSRPSAATAATAPRLVNGMPNPRVNWSKLLPDDQRLVREAILAQLAYGPQSSKQIARAIGSRSGVVGSCLVGCRRRGLVHHNSGRQWKLSSRNDA